MSNKNRKKNRQDAAKWHDGLNPETKHSILAIIFLGLSLLFTLAAFGKAGTIGNSLYSALDFIFGSMFFLVPVFFFIASLISFFSLRANLFLTTIIGGVIFLLSTLGLADIIFGGKTGGYLGFWVSWPFLKFFDFWASLILFAVFFIIGILIMFNIPLKFKKREETLVGKAISKEEEKAQGDVVSSFRELLTDFKNTLGEKGARLHPKPALKCQR